MDRYVLNRFYNMRRVNGSNGAVVRMYTGRLLAGPRLVGVNFCCLTGWHFWQFGSRGRSAMVWVCGMDWPVVVDVCVEGRRGAYWIRAMVCREE